ncbi:MAG: DNA mismatch repair protein MutS, partial [Flavobacteriales bacterium]
MSSTHEDSQEFKDGVVETPLMKQYYGFKSQYPDALLLFRVGDFYETFGEDAVKASAILGIVLTKRKNGSAAFIELAGFPHHSLDTYLPKLVRAGNRVAICEQLEDPKLTKKIVKRGITELVTPGVSYHEKTLDSASNQFLASVVISDGQYGVAFLDISTGEFLTAQGPPEYIDRLLQNFRPSEVLYQRQYERVFKERYTDRFFSYRLDDWIYTPDFAHGILTKHFETKSLKGFGIDELNLGILACGAAMHYLADTQHDRIGHIRHIQRIEEDSHMWLDRFTIRNLELVYSPHEGAQTLLDILDDTRTPMGARLLRRWLLL